MTNTEKVLAVLNDEPQTVSQIASATGLSESVTRKTLAALAGDEQVTRSADKPATFSKFESFSLPGVVEQVLGRKARSATYLHKRLAQRGLPATKGEVKQALVVLVDTGRAAVHFRSRRFAKV